MKIILNNAKPTRTFFTDQFKLFYTNSLEINVYTAEENFKESTLYIKRRIDRDMPFITVKDSAGEYIKFNGPNCMGFSYFSKDGQIQFSIERLGGLLADTEVIIGISPDLIEVI